MAKKVLISLLAGFTLVLLLLLAFVFGFLQRTPSGARGGKPPTLQTDVALLRKQLAIPDGLIAAQWTSYVIERNFPIPAPGTAVLVGRLQFSEKAMTKLLAVGSWRSEMTLPAEFDALQLPDPKPSKLVKSQSVEPGKRLVHSTTWMWIDIWADPDEHALFFVAKKS